MQRANVEYAVLRLKTVQDGTADALVSRRSSVITVNTKGMSRPVEDIASSVDDPYDVKSVADFASQFPDYGGKALRGIGKAKRGFIKPARFDPNAPDADGDGMAQEGTTAEHPVAPGGRARAALGRAFNRAAEAVDRMGDRRQSRREQRKPRAIREAIGNRALDIADNLDRRRGITPPKRKPRPVAAAEDVATGDKLPGRQYGTSYASEAIAFIDAEDMSINKPGKEFHVVKNPENNKIYIVDGDRRDALGHDLIATFKDGEKIEGPTPKQVAAQADVKPLKERKRVPGRQFGSAFKSEDAAAKAAQKYSEGGSGEIHVVKGEDGKFRLYDESRMKAKDGKPLRSFLNGEEFDHPDKVKPEADVPSADGEPGVDAKPEVPWYKRLPRDRYQPLVAGDGAPEVYWDKQEKVWVHPDGTPLTEAERKRYDLRPEGFDQNGMARDVQVPERPNRPERPDRPSSGKRRPSSGKKRPSSSTPRKREDVRWDEENQQYVDTNGDPLNADDLEALNLDPGLRDAPADDIQKFDPTEGEPQRMTSDGTDLPGMSAGQDYASEQIARFDAEQMSKDNPNTEIHVVKEKDGNIRLVDKERRDALVADGATPLGHYLNGKEHDAGGKAVDTKPGTEKKPNIDGVLWDPVNDEYVDADGNALEAADLAERGLDPDGVDVPEGVPDYEGNLNPVGDQSDFPRSNVDSAEWEANRAKHNAVLENREMMADEIQRMLDEGNIDEATRLFNDLEAASVHHNDEIDGGADNTKYMDDVKELDALVAKMRADIEDAMNGKRKKPESVKPESVKPDGVYPNSLKDQWAQGIAEAPGGWADALVPGERDMPAGPKEIAAMNDVFDRAVVKAGDDDDLKQRIEAERKKYLKAVGAAEESAKPASAPEASAPAAPEPPAAKKPRAPRKPKDDGPVREPGMSTAEFERVKRQAAEKKKRDKAVAKKMDEVNAKVDEAKKLDDEREVKYKLQALSDEREKILRRSMSWRRADHLRQQDKEMVKGYDERIQAVRDHLAELKKRPNEVRLAKKLDEQMQYNGRYIDREQGIADKMKVIDQLLANNERVIARGYNADDKWLAEKENVRLKELKAQLEPRLKIEQEYNDLVAGRKGKAKDVIDAHAKQAEAFKMSMKAKVSPNFDEAIGNHSAELKAAQDELAKMGNPSDEKAQLKKAELEGLVAAHTRALSDLKGLQKRDQRAAERRSKGMSTGPEMLPELDIPPAKPVSPVRGAIADHVEGEMPKAKAIVNPNIKTEADAVAHIRNGGSLEEVPNKLWMAAVMGNADRIVKVRDREGLLTPKMENGKPVYENIDPASKFIEFPKKGGRVGDTLIFRLKGPDGKPTGEGFVLKGGKAEDGVGEVVAYNLAAAHGLMPEGAGWDGEQANPNYRRNGWNNNPDNVYVVVPHAFNALGEDMGEIQSPVGRNYDPGLAKGQMAVEGGGTVIVDPTQAQSAMFAHFLHNYLLAVPDRHDANGMTVVADGKVYAIPIDQGWGGQYAPGTPMDYIGQFGMHGRLLRDIRDHNAGLTGAAKQAHAEAMIGVLDGMIERSSELAQLSEADWIERLAPGVDDRWLSVVEPRIKQIQRVYLQTTQTLKRERENLLRTMGLV